MWDLFTSKERDGSCTDAAKALGLSPLATLALRVSLMILSRIIYVPPGRCLKVDIGSSKLSIRVSRVRPSTSSRPPKTKCTDGPVSGYTATTATETALPHPDASSSDGMTATLYDVKSHAYLGAIA